MVYLPWGPLNLDGTECRMATGGHSGRILSQCFVHHICIDSSNNSVVCHCCCCCCQDCAVYKECSNLNSLLNFSRDAPCIQTECTSANTNRHSVTDLSHLLVIALDQTSSVRPDNYSNQALHKTMTRKYLHVLPAEHQTRLLSSHPALTVCTDVPFTRLR